MNIKQYPMAIATLQRQLINCNQNVEQLSLVVERIKGEINSRVAFDQSLKNEDQRKAKRLELTTASRDLKVWTLELETAIEQRDLLQIDLELLRNEFALFKLERRFQIALLEREVA